MDTDTQLTLSDWTGCDVMNKIRSKYFKLSMVLAGKAAGGICGRRFTCCTRLRRQSKIFTKRT